jgi:hypothetical protein
LTVKRENDAPIFELQPAWLSHFVVELKIPRRKACRFDSGLGHQTLLLLTPQSLTSTSTFCQVADIS